MHLATTAPSATHGEKDEEEREAGEGDMVKAKIMSPTGILLFGLLESTRLFVIYKYIIHVVCSVFSRVALSLDQYQRHVVGSRGLESSHGLHVFLYFESARQIPA